MFNLGSIASIYGLPGGADDPWADYNNLKGENQAVARKGVGMGAVLNSIGDRIQQTQQARVDLARDKADKIGNYIANRQRMELLARGLGAIGGY